MTVYDELLEEAFDRLKTDIAEDVDDVVFQLRDEGLIDSDELMTAIASDLHAEGYV